MAERLITGEPVVRLVASYYYVFNDDGTLASKTVTVYGNVRKDG